MDCKVCNSAVSKYKCPSCRIPYCSLCCWKTHKSEGCGDVTRTGTATATVTATATTPVESGVAIPETRAATYNFPTEDTVPPEKLKQLGDNEQLKNILCNPHVRSILSALDKTANPRQLLHEAMQEPIFVEFVDECMRTVDPPSKEELDEAMIQL